VFLVLIILAVLLLAYSNGANDNFKGVATLFGSGTARYGLALTWATLTTLAGSLLALYLAQGLVETFKGKGLVPEALTHQPTFLLAVSLGAALTVLLATFAGLPVSTTHALTGALVGAGLVATAGTGVRFGALGTSFVLPLLVAPVLALVLTVLIYPLFGLARRTAGVTRQTCLCVGATEEEVRTSPEGTMSYVRTGLAVEVGQVNQCVERYRGTFLSLEVGRFIDVLHYLSAGAVGFARGLNDTPKIVALLIGAEALAPNSGLLAIALVMALGGVLSARRVAQTMSQKITRMNPGQGFTANLVTASLVALASPLALPVSTTHVSVGSLFGIGLVNGTARPRMILTILLAWLTTLPLGALLAGTLGWLVGVA
jgi:PiT family inorganic phosphate transporter